MEPEKVFLRAGGRIIVLAAERFTILAYCVSATAGTVEADALAVCLVVVNGFPLVREVWLVAVGFRTIVMVAFEDVMKAKGHHIVHACLTAFCHHCCHRLHKVFLV